MKKVENYKRAVKEIRSELKNYIVKNKLEALVIGESGGIDSALCSALAYPVCLELDVKLVGRSITIQTNKPDEISRGKAIGQNFCTDFKEIDLTQQFHVLASCVEAEPNDGSLTWKLRQGNIKARIRMIYLYDLAQKHKGMVLSTDNLTELLLGFWTLHGDVGDFGMIQQLWKTEVYEMSKYLVENELREEPEKQKALKDCIDAVPTDGLGISNSDLDQLGAKTYDEVDQILQHYMANATDPSTAHPVIQRHVKSEFKRNNPYNIARNVYLREK